MSLPPLSVAIGADTKGLEGGLANATSLLKRFAGPAAVGGAIAALRGMTRAGMENIDAQAKLARAVGGTTTGLQALARAGDRAGVQTSELQSATTRLNQRLGQVISTGKGAEDTFKALGLNAQQLADMDIDQRFMAISNAMRDAGMSSQEMSFHLRELGIRQASVISLVQGGAEEIERSRQAVIDFGVAVSEVDAASIERANDALSEVGRVFEGLRNQMAVQMAPSIEAVANAFTEMAREGGLVYNLIRGFVEQLPRITSYLTAAAAGLATYTGVLVAAAAAKAAMALAAQGLRAALLRLGFPALIIAAGEMLHQFSRLTQATGTWGNALDALRSLASAVWENIKTTGASIHPALSAVWADVKSSFFNAVAEMQWRWSEFLGAIAEGLRGIPFIGDDVADKVAGSARRAAEGWEAFTGAANDASNAAAGFRDEAAGLVSEGFEGIAGALSNLRDIMNSADEEIYGGGGASAPSAEGGSGGGGSGGGSGGLADKLRDRLETLQTGLMTEAEVLEAWYAESLETLEEARARELITEQEYWDAKARLQQEYNQRSQGMMREELQMRQQTFNAMTGLLTQFGQRSKVPAKAAVVLNAAQRVSEIMASTASAAMSAAAATPGGPAAKMAAAARVSAYGKVQAGIAAASAALRLGGGASGGGGGASSGSGAAASQSQAAQVATQRLRLEIVGSGPEADAAFRTLQLVQQAIDNGGRLDGLIAERVAG